VHADEVRKILGKKKVELVEAEGKLFVPACAERGMDANAASQLWDQLAEFSRYSFNKAHAYAYAVLGYWTAWFKFHFPREFLVAALSTVDKDRIPDFVNEARRMGYKILPPDINESGRGFSGLGVNVRYGLDSVKGVADKALEAILPGQPYASWDDFLERKGAGCDSGVVKSLAQVGAFDRWWANRRALEEYLERKANGEDTRCTHKDTTVRNKHNALPCTFDWDTREREIGKSGKPLKLKPVPKKCTVRCPFYSPSGSIDVADVVPYTDAEIRQRESDLLGVCLSSSPFDILTLDEAGCVELQGRFVTVATVSRIRKTRDRRGGEMAFLSLFAMNGDLDVTCFASLWEKNNNLHKLTKDQLVLAEISKNGRGCVLDSLDILHGY
jgi:DNA polymerase-3 subunit alpha